MKPISRFFAELLRRKVVRLLGAYIALVWLLAEGCADVCEPIGLPDWTLRALIFGGIALAPVVALLSWRYDLVLPQLVRDSSDAGEVNKAVRWAMQRHENTDGSYVLLRWDIADEKAQEKRFFKPVGIGRGLINEVDLADERVSRNHAVLWAEGGEWHIKDLDSANGTFIDNVAVAGTATLPLSCELRFHRRGPVVQVSVSKPVPTLVKK